MPPGITMSVKTSATPGRVAKLGDRRRAVVCLDHLIAEASQAAAQDLAQARVVLDEENGLRASRQLRLDRRREGGVLRRILGLRQVDADARPPVGLAVELDVAARLLDEAVDHAEAEARPGADRLGGEERLEGLAPHLFRHARPGVGDGDQHIAAGADLGVHLGIVGVEADKADVDGELAPAGHGVAGVDSEIEHCVLQLGRVDHRRARLGRNGDLELDRLAERAAQKLGVVEDMTADIDRLRIEGLAPGEGEELGGELGAVLRRALGLAHELAMVRIGEHWGEKLEIADDRGQDVVEVVGDAAR